VHRDCPEESKQLNYESFFGEKSGITIWNKMADCLFFLGPISQLVFLAYHLHNEIIFSHILQSITAGLENMHRKNIHFKHI